MRLPFSTLLLPFILSGRTYKRSNAALDIAVHIGSPPLQLDTMRDLVVLLLCMTVSIFGAPPFLGDNQWIPPRSNGRQLEDDNEIPNIVNFGLSREHPDQPVVIYRQIQDQDVQGSYAWEYELENSIRANEGGYLKNAGTPNETQVAQGSFSYVAPDGITYTVTYIADENGFQAQGLHLPTPPPMPIELERAYAVARARPGYRDQED